LLDDGEKGMSMCLQTNTSALAQVAGLAKRFPRVPIIIDHLGRPDVTDGPPCRNAASLFELAPLKNVFLKLTPRIFVDAWRGQATPETLFPQLVDVFGSDRMVWGSNFPASEGDLATNLEMAKSSLQTLSAEDRSRYSREQLNDYTQSLLTDAQDGFAV
jgi:L-fuconolactonase